MKRDIGSTVTIRKDLEKFYNRNERLFGNSVTESMLKYIGQQMIIEYTTTIKESKEPIQYRMIGNPFYWTELMFDPGYDLLFE